MAARKIAITVDERLLRQVDGWVAQGEYPSRSRAFQEAVARLGGERRRRGRLVRELARLVAGEEQAIADEALAAEEPWPEYWGARSILPPSGEAWGMSKRATVQ